MRRQALIREIASWADTVQRLLHDLYDIDPGNPTFEQAGLLDGKDTVDEFLVHNELGCALEHLLYMIHESEVEVDRAIIDSVHLVVAELGIENPYE